MFGNWLFKVLLAIVVIFLETRAPCETPPRKDAETASPTNEEILKAYFEGKRLLIPGNPDRRTCTRSIRTIPRTRW